MKVKLTAAMIGQLLEYLSHVEYEGTYWGNKEQFWKRHEQIVAWVKQECGLKFLDK
jgi:hypothetical protein